MSKTTLIAAAFAAAAAFATPATSQQIVAIAPSDATPTIPVSFADLNLNSSAGIEALDSRVRAAARQVCGIRNDRESLGEYVSGKGCYRDSLALARDDMNRAVAQAKNGVAIASLPPIQVSRR